MRTPRSTGPYRRYAASEDAFEYDYEKILAERDFPVAQLHLLDKLFRIDNHFIKGIAHFGKFAAGFHFGPNG